MGDRRRKTIHGYLSFGRSGQPGAIPPGYRWDERWPNAFFALGPGGVATFVAITIGDTFWTQLGAVVVLGPVVLLALKAGFAGVEWLVRRRAD